MSEEKGASPRHLPMCDLSGKCALRSAGLYGSCQGSPKCVVDRAGLQVTHEAHPEIPKPLPPREYMEYYI